MPRGKKTEPATVEVKEEDVMLDDGTSLSDVEPELKGETVFADILDQADGQDMQQQEDEDEKDKRIKELEQEMAEMRAMMERMQSPRWFR